MNEVLEAIQKRSSTRGYSDQKLTDEEIETIIKAGLQAPTAANKQEIHISVVDGSNPILEEIETEKNKILKVESPANNFYYQAPTVFVLSGDKKFPWSPVDAGIAVENMALAAEGLGLGSVIIGIIKDALKGDKEEYFAEELGFPEGYEYEVALAVGHKAIEKEQHEFDLDKHVTFVK